MLWLSLSQYYNYPGPRHSKVDQQFTCLALPIINKRSYIYSLLPINRSGLAFYCLNEYYLAID